MSLTKAQKKALDRQVEETRNLMLSTEPVDRKRAEKAIRKLYRLKNLGVPKFYWYASPLAAIEAAKKETGRDIKNDTVFYGAAEHAKTFVYAFAEQELGIEYTKEQFEELAVWAEINNSCGWWWSYQGAVIICDRPVSIVPSASGHHLMTWADGTGNFK